MAQKRSWIQALADKTDLTTEPLPGIPVVEIAGNRRVLVEGHHGVTSYDDREVCMNVAYGQIKIGGTDLYISKMTQQMMVVTGNITDVQLLRREF